MILVPSPLRLLSGSKYTIVLCVLLIAGCSPKLVVVKPDTGKVPPAKEKPQVETPAKKKEVDHAIGLLLPFELNTINIATAGLKELNKPAFAIEFYQGFKLALDSLSQRGHNYKLHVFDTQDRETQVVNLARAASVRQNDLVVGPVFPKQISTYSEFSDRDSSKLQVTPLAASPPSEFNNPSLVSINNSIDQHGWKIADFINRRYRPELVNIILVNTDKADDAKLASPVRKYINELGKGGFRITERQNATDLQKFIVPGKNNLVVITSSERTLVKSILDRLYISKNEGREIEVFGHPNWVKATFLDGSLLEALKTKVSASYFVDYEAENVKRFAARYRASYGFEPTEFSFKGFDTGYFFGRLLEKYGSDYARHVTRDDYKGLHNNFRFSRDPKLGYTNDELMMLTYRGLELQPVR